ncbi:glutamyl tRNA reductase [Wigglesworthia glossinidia endosymbiont of Glossina morsitans morsitans (Yale colony)]|uniref:Glutamyl-tRNA reductase n=1 Tax=Wigglesworthia glossinidia endosymbiont of Glossina morsitans morsitans (Yale colony) TaxID=1142511 RepID=H6Q4W9_WIGGL|nr:glutamyl-tRNA reductase [Wigglesworthia glossinidia]AFA41252.1 glutamyl tRNA reductase [Wigglesworthia glossinidia endosymbiont of Glossina morsitans morsitans (Yale colony)]
MKLVVIGVSYKTAPISLREKMIFSTEHLDMSLNNLLKQINIKGGLILSTCNRIEIYLSVKKLNNLKKILINWLYKFYKIEFKFIRHNIYYYLDNRAIIHLMRVMSGLDSMILGESQIINQVKSAFFRSLKRKNLSVDMQKLFERVFAVSKKIRTQTKIGSYSISISYAIYILLKNKFQSLTEIQILLIGSGKISTLVAKQLYQYNVKKIFIANRTLQHAKNLALKINGFAIELKNVAQYLSKVHVVITSTSSSTPILYTDTVRNVLKKNKKIVLFIDIAVPRNIQSSIGNLPNADLYILDDLQIFLNKNLEKRKHAAMLAENIIKQESIKLSQWLQGYSAAKIIQEYRNQIEQVKKIYENRALMELKIGINPEIIIKKIIYKLTNRLMHNSTKLLYNTAFSQKNDALKILYNHLKLKLH